MRKNIVAGNWKMNTTVQDGVSLAQDINALLKDRKVNCEVIMCVPFTHLYPVAAVNNAELAALGAEDCSEHDKGAYTGEVSAAMIASAGATHVIIGHSERRQYFGETNEQLLAKVRRALASGLTPIFCIGEVLEERQNGSYNEVVKAQIEALFELEAADFAKIIVAYEPVWAIGTGQTATAEQAQDMHANIRAAIAGKYGRELADNTSILYGGSCKPANACELFAKPDVDGGLIGGASLQADSFLGIIAAFD